MKIRYAKEIALFVGGVAFGTAGVKILSSQDAKRAYAHTTAAVLRAKECVMDVVSKIQENAGDVLAEAKEINAARAAAASEECSDDCECGCGCDAEAVAAEV